MKKVAIVLFIASLSLSACAKRYTCPTYLKNSDDNKDIKAKTEVKKAEESKN